MVPVWQVFVKFSLLNIEVMATNDITGSQITGASENWSEQKKPMVWGWRGGGWEEGGERKPVRFLY